MEDAVLRVREAYAKPLPPGGQGTIQRIKLSSGGMVAIHSRPGQVFDLRSGRNFAGHHIHVHGEEMTHDKILHALLPDQVQEVRKQIDLLGGYVNVTFSEVPFDVVELMKTARDPGAAADNHIALRQLTGN